MVYAVGLPDGYDAHHQGQDTEYDVRNGASGSIEGK